MKLSKASEENSGIAFWIHKTKRALRLSIVAGMSVEEDSETGGKGMARQTSVTEERTVEQSGNVCAVIKLRSTRRNRICCNGNRERQKWVDTCGMM